MKTNNLLLLGSLAVVLPACKMPPKQAWQQIQTEGLMAYMGAEPMQRQAANQGRETFAWNEGSASKPSGSRSTGRSVFGSTANAGIPVPGHPGFVYSPHAREKMVNVTNFKAGQQVRCPHTKKMFIVPDFSKPAPSIASTPNFSSAILPRADAV